jgi:hypothetical protein
MRKEVYQGASSLCPEETVSAKMALPHKSVSNNYRSSARRCYLRDELVAF